jgi:tetratricopeptide (TPR) repeat protein
LSVLLSGSVGAVAKLAIAGERATPVSVAIVPQPSTSGPLAVANLDSQIEWTRRAARDSDDPALARQLAILLLQRATFLGRVDDLDEAQTLSGADVARRPRDPAAWLGRADFLTAVHRFDEARLALSRAEASGADANAVERARWGLDLATGSHPDRLVDLAHRRRLARPNLQSWTDEANALAAAGRFEAADGAYRAAQESYRDVSPFPLAWLAFQRGLVWAEAADRRDIALPLYQEAVRYLPGYASANVHLAELEAAAGNRAAAVRRLRSAAETSLDPEPSAVLARLLQETEPEEAARLAVRARGRYEVLLSRHRAAFLDHAAEFYAGAGGDTAVGVTLALENLAVRPTARAFIVAIEAAEAAGEVRLACGLAAQASPLRARVPALAARIGAFEADCVP